MSKVEIEIAIPAYNEAGNIIRLIGSILAQEQDDYKIDRIILVSDGSTDETVKKARELNLGNLHIVEHHENLGKSTRLDEIFKLARQDIVVLFDGDVVLDSPRTISHLVRPLVDKKATLVSGRPVKVDSQSFTDKVMGVSLYLQDCIKALLHRTDSVYACHGRVLAMHRQVFSQLALPYSPIGNDAFLYFFNKKHGQGFAYVSEATVLFKMPQSFQDYAKQQRRFARVPAEQVKIFGEDIRSEYFIPLVLKIKAMLQALSKHHVYAVAYVAYQLFARFQRAGNEAQWRTVETTKNL